MNYRHFSVKSKPIILLFQTMTIRLLGFHCLGGYLFLLYLMNSRLKVLPKRFKYSIRVWNYGDDVNVPRSNRWRHVLCWRKAFSALDVRRTATDCGIFFCADFLRFIALNMSKYGSHFVHGTLACYFRKISLILYWSYFPADRLILTDMFGNNLQWPKCY